MFGTDAHWLPLKCRLSWSHEKLLWDLGCWHVADLSLNTQKSSQENRSQVNAVKIRGRNVSWFYLDFFFLSQFYLESVIHFKPNGDWIIFPVHYVKTKWKQEGALLSIRCMISPIITPSIWVRNNLPNGEKTFNSGKRWKKPQEPQRRDPSSRKDRHAMDHACTEQKNKITVDNLH